MIKKFKFNGMDHSFITDGVDLNQNTFTTIIGKNGSGKSRMLRQLIDSCLNARLCGKSLDGQSLPSSVIAVSTSPFDRFELVDSPFERQSERLINVRDYYFYQGLRGIFSVNLGMSYMVRTMSSLIRALDNNSERLITVLDVLDYLGFKKGIRAKFRCEITTPTLNKLAAGNLIMDQVDIQRWGNEARRLMHRLEDSAPGYREEVASAISHYVTVSRGVGLDIEISELGVIDLASGLPIDVSAVTLIECGVLKLRSLSLQKKSDEREFKISDASSGEQCVVLTMLGIAARIKDGSLICIDEPEICLHPEWQEKFIELLMLTFRDFRSCQFIIATHSPQIVSRLGSKNCFVLTMHDGQIEDAVKYNNRSADFQLAEVFNTPGFKNEYLMRELLSILVSLSSGKELSNENRDFIANVIGLKESINHGDPVLDLIVLLEESIRGQEQY